MDLFSPTMVGILFGLLAGLAALMIYGATRHQRSQKRPSSSPPADSSPEIHRSSSPHRGALVWARAVMGLAAALAAVFLLLAAMPSAWFDHLGRQLSGSSSSHEAADPLLLESMDEDRSNNQFRVFGTVRNVAEHPLIQPQVIVKIYGMNGELMDTTVAPLKETVLAPQAITEFSVRYLRNPKEISRYSVSFKNQDGSPLRHKDARNRSGLGLAQK